MSIPVPKRKKNPFTALNFDLNRIGWKWARLVAKLDCYRAARRRLHQFPVLLPNLAERMKSYFLLITPSPQFFDSILYLRTM